MHRRRTLALPMIAAVAILALAACSDTGRDAPAAPTDVAADAGPGYMIVSWTDRSDDETGFAVYRSSVATAGLAPQQGTRIGTTGPNETSFVDHGAEVDAGYRYGVAALGPDGQPGSTTTADTTAVIEPGVDIAVGTIGRDDGTTGTAFILYLYFPLGDLEPSEVTMTITGPPGWNGDEPYVRPASVLAVEDGWVTFARVGIDAVEGAYQIEATAGADVYQGTAQLTDADFVYPRATGITVTQADPTSVEVGWEAVPEATSYTVALWTESYGSFVEGYFGTTDTSFVFQGLDLADGTYLVEVDAWPFDQSPGAPPPVAPDPYGFSYDEVTFEIGAGGS